MNENKKNKDNMGIDDKPVKKMTPLAKNIQFLKEIYKNQGVMLKKGAEELKRLSSYVEGLKAERSQMKQIIERLLHVK